MGLLEWALLWEAFGESPVEPHGGSLLRVSSKKPGSLEILLSFRGVKIRCSCCCVVCSHSNLVMNSAHPPSDWGDRGENPGSLHVSFLRNALMYFLPLTPLYLEGLAMHRPALNILGGEWS